MYDFNVMKMLRKHLESYSIFSKYAIFGKLKIQQKKEEEKGEIKGHVAGHMECGPWPHGWLVCVNKRMTRDHFHHFHL